MVERSLYLNVDQLKLWITSEYCNYSTVLYRTIQSLQLSRDLESQTTSFIILCREYSVQSKRMAGFSALGAELRYIHTPYSMYLVMRSLAVLDTGGLGMASQLIP